MGTTKDDDRNSGALSRRSMLKAGAAGVGAAGLAATGIISGASVAWGSSPGATYTVQPYTLSPGATETFRIRERLNIRIDGVGQELIYLQGTAVFNRSEPRLAPEAEAAGLELAWGTAEVGATFLSLQVTGQSNNFGRVRAYNSQDKLDQANVRPDPGVAEFFASSEQPVGTVAADCAASLYPQVTLEGLGITVSTGDQPVTLGSQVAMIPPVGDVARTSGSQPLYDESGRQVGTLLGADIEIGELIDRVMV